MEQGLHTASNTRYSKKSHLNYWYTCHSTSCETTNSSTMPWQYKNWALQQFTFVNNCATAGRRCLLAMFCPESWGFFSSWWPRHSLRPAAAVKWYMLLSRVSTRCQCFFCNALPSGNVRKGHAWSTHCRVWSASPQSHGADAAMPPSSLVTCRPWCPFQS